MGSRRQPYGNFFKKVPCYPGVIYVPPANPDACLTHFVVPVQVITCLKVSELLTFPTVSQRWLHFTAPGGHKGDWIYSTYIHHNGGTWLPLQNAFNGFWTIEKLRVITCNRLGYTGNNAWCKINTYFTVSITSFSIKHPEYWILSTMYLLIYFLQNFCSYWRNTMWWIILSIWQYLKTVFLQQCF